MKEMKMPPKLVLRIHSSNSEIDAVVAMSRPFFDPDEKEMPYHYNPNIKVTDGLPRSLLDAYLIHYRGTSDTSLCNRRMKEVDGSAANYILELANHPGFPRSPEVLATFTNGELRDLEDKLAPIIQAYEDLLDNGDVMDNDIKRAVKSAAKTGYHALLEKAAVVCTTSSVATEMSFNVVRQSHAVFLEESGRANDAEIAGYFSHHWQAQLRMFIGSTNQLPPKKRMGRLHDGDSKLQCSVTGSTIPSRNSFFCRLSTVCKPLASTCTSSSRHRASRTSLCWTYALW
jgi:hypothetical protein